MLNIGLIGNTENLKHFAKEIQKNKQVNIIGKASVGTVHQLNSFHYSIPEINRIELIERADILLIDNSFVMANKLYGDIIRKSKHIFAVKYPDFTIDECTQLVKLANESGSVVQISNPYFYTPAVQWLGKNGFSPVFLDIANFTENEEKSEKLFQILLMLIDLTGISPKKVGAVTFKSAPNESDFTNIRLEYDDASIVNISYGKIGSVEEFKIRAYTRDQFTTFNFLRNTFVCNNQPIKFSDTDKVDEFESFIKSILSNSKKKSTLEDYLIVLSLAQKINKKITQFNTQ
ncbi:MAG: hypothetical protein CSA36_06960 [Draconibacterium sp.]|nr:MAG: hypothetical protein CSA36_06960 [Draconibacterium sp.]